MYELSPWTTDHPAVEVWSERRLPFEPKGTLLELRTRMRAELRNLRVADDEVIEAAYQSDDLDFCDVENVLFYNVGAVAFSASRARAVRFWRSFGSPPTAPSGGQLPHYSCYRAGTAISRFQSEARLSVLRSAPFPSASKLRDPWFVWHSVRTGDFEGEAFLASTEKFSLRVALEIGASHFRPTVVPLLKPVLDGLVTALHSHDGRDLDQICARLSTRLPILANEVSALLVHNPATLLGTRRLVWPFRDGLQLNPADDRLAAAEFAVTLSGDGETRICAEIFRAGP
ncbi:MAG: hypothetical protein AB7H85_11950 [Dehalococcoidia bacterium]